MRLHAIPDIPMVVIGLAETVYAGNKHTLKFPVTDQDTIGSPLKNLTGMAARWALSKFKSDGTHSTTPVLAKNSTSPSQIAITDALNGMVEVYIAEGLVAAGGTGDLAGDYYMELEIYSTGSFSLVVATGTLTVLKNITNP